jgi:uncharacterized circularly permuted ATP-grasp superfamily protein
VLQRTRLLDRIMADVYGPQQLLAGGLLPSALVQGHPGYLRAMHGVPPVGGTHLHIAAFDLARGADGHWWVVSQRTQAPSGLGYLLENRLIVPRACSPRPFATCTCSGWRPATARWWTACARRAPVAPTRASCC